MTALIHWAGVTTESDLIPGAQITTDRDKVNCAFCKGVAERSRPEPDPTPAAVYVGDDSALTGLEYMVTIWPDGTAELASRTNGWQAWGPPTPMREVSADGTYTEDPPAEEPTGQAKGAAGRRRQGSVRPE